MNFLGTFSASDLLAAVTGGVQNTGASLWPLFSIVGIALAFVIAGFVVSFIRKSVGNQNPDNLPGLPGYDSRRGSGASARNVALTDADSGGHMKSYTF